MWIFSNLYWLRKFNLTLFLTIQKIGPIIILWNLSSINSWLYFYYVINIIIAPLIRLLKNTIKEILIITSISLISFILLNFKKKTLFTFFFLFYLISIYLLLNTNYSSTKNFLLTMIIYCIIRGFPTSIIFIIKINIFFNIKLLSSGSIYLLIIFLRMLFYLYIKFFFIKLSYKLHINLLITKKLKSKHIVFLIFIQICGLYWIYNLLTRNKLAINFILFSLSSTRIISSIIKAKLRH